MIIISVVLFVLVMIALIGVAVDNDRLWNRQIETFNALNDLIIGNNQNFEFKYYDLKERVDNFKIVSELQSKVNIDTSNIVGNLIRIMKESNKGDKNHGRKTVVQKSSK